MTCHQIEDLILDGVTSAEIDAHLGTCLGCAEFARVQRDLDLRLRTAFPAPCLSESFRKDLDHRVRTEKARQFRDLLPEVISLVAGAVCTAICMWLRPELADSLLALGIFWTLVAMVAPSLVDWVAEGVEEQP
jgi:hypothetical protein